MLLSLTVWVAAQGQTSRYVYDDDGRLRAVIAPNGEAAIYEYDAAGNFTAIRRLTSDSLELITFSPRFGVPGTQVVFNGVGFGAGVSAVTFSGGAAAQVVSFTNNTITAIVPEGTITGPVTITTARGTLVTSTPFTIQGVIVNPREASVIDGSAVQFAATVIVPGDDEEVSWTVNGVAGGSSTLGTISTTGLYTGPLDPPASFDVTVSAVSVALPMLEGKATVHVRSTSDFRFTFSPAVSIARGQALASTFVPSQGVSIAKGETFAGAFVPSRGVSVAKGGGVSNLNLFGPGVAVTKGPIVSAVSPGSLTQGSNGVVTLSGLNFTGANGVRLFNLDGNEAFGITASNISVNPNGTSLTVNLSVQAVASVGRKIIVVTTPTAHSVWSDLIVNTIQITAP